MATTTDVQLRAGESPRLAAGSWRLRPVDAFASFTARLPWRQVRGRLPLSGEVLITEPVEASRASLTASTRAVSTGSPVLDRVLAGPAFLDAHAYPDISFQSDLLTWVPTGWRAVGCLRVKDREHELVCQFGVRLGDPEPGDMPAPVITCSWAIDSAWISSQRIPALDRRIEMTCSFRLDPLTRGHATPQSGVTDLAPGCGRVPEPGTSPTRVSS